MDTSKEEKKTWKQEQIEKTDIEALLYDMNSVILETKEMLEGLRIAAFDMAEFQGSFINLNGPDPDKPRVNMVHQAADWAQQFHKVTFCVLLSTIKMLGDIEKKLEPLV